MERVRMDPFTSESLASESVSSDGTASESSTSDGALSADTIKSARVTTTDFQPTLSDVPLVTGLTFDYVTVNKQLPVEKTGSFPHHARTYENDGEIQYHAGQCGI